MSSIHKPRSRKGKIRMAKNNRNHRMIEEKIPGSDGCVIVINYDPHHRPMIREFRGR